VKPRAANLLAAADRAIASAHRELAARDVEAAAERAHAAMLRLAQASLEADDLAPVRREAVCAAYGERFGRTGRLYSAYHRWLLDAGDLRKAASGEIAEGVGLEAVVTVVERSEIFRDAVARFLERAD
jgi:uncharacterized protein (UPF0332 family)